MKQSTEELKAIIENAPEGATHYNKKGEYKYLKLTYFSGYQAFTSSGNLLSVSPDKLYCLRSLSDIKEIVELREWINKSHEAYKKTEEVKQRYSAESKAAKSALASLVHACDNNTGCEPSLSCYYYALDGAKEVL